MRYIIFIVFLDLVTFAIGATGVISLDLIVSKRHFHYYVVAYGAIIAGIYPYLPSYLVDLDDEVIKILSMRSFAWTALAGCFFGLMLRGF